MWTNSTGVKSRILAFRDGPARRNALGELKMQRDLQRPKRLDQACVRAVYCASFLRANSLCRGALRNPLCIGAQSGSESTPRRLLRCALPSNRTAI